MVCTLCPALLYPVFHFPSWNIDLWGIIAGHEDQPAQDPKGGGAVSGKEAVSRALHAAEQPHWAWMMAWMTADFPAFMQKTDKV